MKPDCLNNCAHCYIAYYAETFGGPVAVAGCRVDSCCLVGQDVCAKYECIDCLATNAADDIPEEKRNDPR